MTRVVVRSLFCAVVFSLLGVSAHSYAATPAQVSKLTFIDSSLGGYSLPYNLFLPADYDPNGPALPVILFLHGAGERGSDNSSQINGNVQPLINATQGATGTHRAIVIAPQCPSDQVWNSINSGDNWTPGGSGISSYAETTTQQANRSISNALQAAIDLVSSIQATQRVDGNRLYVTGLSMGGFGTWDAITRFPDRFAAAMPLSGGGNTLAASLLANEPIWAYHGATDTTVYPNGSEDVISAIRNSGGTRSIYSEQGGTGHWGWNVFYTPYSSATTPGDVAYWAYSVGDSRTTGGMPAYADNGVYDWLFQQTLSVPEPSTLSILFMTSIGLLGRRRSNSPLIVQHERCAGGRGVVDAQ